MIGQFVAILLNFISGPQLTLRTRTLSGGDVAVALLLSALCNETGRMSENITRGFSLGEVGMLGRGGEGTCRRPVCRLERELVARSFMQLARALKRSKSSQNSKQFYE